MTTVKRDYPARVDFMFRGKRGQIVLDQIRTVDRSRFVKRLGRLDASTGEAVLNMLARIFAP